MWESDLKLDKYQYVKTNPYLIRTIAVLGILTTLLMGYGLYQYAQIEPIYLFIFGPVIAIFIFNKLLRFFIQLFFPKFDIKKHEEFVNNYWATNPEPSVNVFLPWAGEDLEIHEEVVRAVRNLDYKNYKVYMLDDVGREDYKALAERYGFNYLSRPNKGVYKKSGNLQYGYEHSDGEFVLILDADFIPTRSALRDLVPYMVADPEMGILQTPQYFEQTKNVHTRSMIEFGGGNIVEDFYRIVMPCRDEFRAGMCVGTSALYRRAAIEKLDGTPKVHASEDLATGLLITRYGYYVKYLALIVSMGKSPETYQGYFKQHMRWCSGNLVFAKYWPTARLNLMARIIYMTNPMYYLSEALTIVFSFQFLILLYFHADSLSLWNTLYFVPYILLSRIVVPLAKANKNKLGTKLAALSNSYTYFYTYIRMLTKGVPAWHPTGVKISKLHDDFISAFNIGSFVSITFIAGFLFVLFSRPQVFGNYNTYIVLGWTFYSVFWHALFLTFILRYIHPFQMEQVKGLGKLFISAKTFSVPALCFVLSGFAVFNFTAAAFNPETPTRQVVASLIEGETSIVPQVPVATAAPNEATSEPQSDQQLALAETNTENKEKAKEIAQADTTVLQPNPQVLAATKSVEAEEIKYTYLVVKGDTLLKLATKAVDEYSTKTQIEVNLKQKNYAAAMIVKNGITDRKALKIGNEISFKESMVSEYVDTALADKRLLASN